MSIKGVTVPDLVCLQNDICWDSLFIMLHNSNKGHLLLYIIETKPKQFELYKHI